ncbi:uncharacterized protein F5891DRAFT_1250415 [Suillus fuscotomentosus]|uniref:RGS domain-containing protein n=1 Tax=Suillus fuscotomentosus TaxID=1912939 RepID=A0AAD4DY85_9AGAM|nr:uncharacterized protein F5891DRAFT_1250415 [Suillus fuscotomentosus]KAG1895847.1 hypothetical protein F5891DRAFT_1250415 [Suillus fuscotomentosus]
MLFAFELGKYLPFEQLMGVLPPASTDHISLAYQDLMYDANSPILDFYPLKFEQDLSEKKQAWEAIVRIPFIDEQRLLQAMHCPDVDVLVHVHPLKGAYWYFINVRFYTFMQFLSSRTTPLAHVSRCRHACWSARIEPARPLSALHRLKYILEEPSYRALFRNFLKANFCEENLAFWMDVEDFKRNFNTTSSAQAAAPTRSGSKLSVRRKAANEGESFLRVDIWDVNNVSPPLSAARGEWTS